MTFPSDLKTHLKTGATTLCHAWLLQRGDGVALGFTDHDCAVTFDGVTYQPDAGFSAAAVARASGLSVDNTEIVGALSHLALTEADLRAGRYDDAKVSIWRLNWRAPEQRVLLFAGSLGQVKLSGHEFRAELRGLSEKLNTPLGRVYQKPCTTMLGSAECGIDASDEKFVHETAIQRIDKRQYLTFGDLPFEDGWFDHGYVDFLSGGGHGLRVPIASDHHDSAGRVISLVHSVEADVQPSDMVRLTAGCDRRFKTCRTKFANHLNFRGFPHLPSDDWIIANPARMVGRT